LTHRYLFLSGAYPKNNVFTRDSLPKNPAAERLADGLGQAHKNYAAPDAFILFVVQDMERNAFDQRRLEYHPLDHHIRTVRMCLSEIGTFAYLDDNRSLMVPVVAMERAVVEVSVVYFRAGYGPGDYPSEREWQARGLLERSRAIKCPTIITQLTGCKKVQQVLAMPGVLERYVT
jgi:hypothetical protein